MKNTENDEVDLLLRSLARRGTGQMEVAPGPENGGASNHLDADELSSYAEGVVPMASRARYTAHLADCQSCRHIMVRLSQAAGMRRQRAGSEHADLGFWTKFAALFSAPVLRYAVPAFAIAAVIAISLIGLRQQRGPEFVAQNQPMHSATPLNAAAPTDSQSSDEPSKEEAKTAATANTDPTRQTSAAATDKSAVIGPAGVGRASAETLSDASRSQPTPVAALRPGVAEPPPAKPVAPFLQPSVEPDKMKAVAKTAETEGNTQERRRAQDKNEIGYANASPSPATDKLGTLSAKRSGGLRAENKADNRSGDKDQRQARDEGETRSVAGRQFRRHGNTWIDTAYTLSRATINVARGSEQFRALVADEPTIRTVSQQLSGEVIVVWKGKAYRIH
ncbi:MAG: hypothetical protein ABR501_00595 [Pyrinomonadaceae bacterium]